jgi:superoxide dismutase, Cu-Zn family
MKLMSAAAALVVLTSCRTAGRGAPSWFADMRMANGTAIGRIVVQPEASGGVRISGDLTGLPPGEHGMHFHTVGLCAAPEFTTAGGHFNPTSKQHGFDNPAGPHAGDWPNLAVTAAGTARVALSTTRLSLDPMSPIAINDMDGTAIVIHASSDDQRTDPSGNSGARIACGVITLR